VRPVCLAQGPPVHLDFPNVSVKTNVYVAGDNDIGGDGGNPVTAEKLDRFRDHFPSKSYYVFRGTSGVDVASASEDVRSGPPARNAFCVHRCRFLTERPTAGSPPWRSFP
jgi:hypothetical protein